VKLLWSTLVNSTSNSSHRKALPLRETPRIVAVPGLGTLLYKHGKLFGCAYRKGDSEGTLAYLNHTAPQESQRATPSMDLKYCAAPGM